MDDRDPSFSSDPKATPPDGGSLDHPTVSAGDLKTQAVNAVSGSAADGLPDIPGYRILRVLGEGGMGVVYEAEQADPRRKVALKVVRGGAFITEEMTRLFEREVSTLGRLNHPAIASIYEAGRTPSGQRFFAMEIVDGEPLNTALAGLGDDPRSRRLRLEMFIEICDAIEYAHQRGVIHRDLKPTNILVRRGGDTTTGSGSRVKVLDFGLARITDADVSLATMQTEVGKIQGTLAYMSPEQARGRPDEIDTRADIYSLGVILYELLTGIRPYDVNKAMIHEAVRVILEEEPVKLGSIARHLKGDIETIALKALEKDPARRYASVGALADDVRRHLTSQPILARPPSAAYQFRKLVVRHKAPFVFAGALFIVLIISTVTMAFLYQAQRRESRRAREAEGRATTINDFLVNDLLKAASPEVAQGRDVTVAEAMDGASRRVEGAFKGKPELEVPIRKTLGEVYTQLGKFSEAKRHLTAAAELSKATFGARDPRTLEIEEGFGGYYFELREFERAESIYRDVLQEYRRTLGPDDSKTLEVMSGLGNVTMESDTGEGVAEAVKVLREVLDRRRAVLGENDPMTVLALINFATALSSSDSSAADGALREACERARAVLGEKHPETLVVEMNYASWFFKQRRFEDATRMDRAVLTPVREVFGDRHPTTLILMYNLAGLLGVQSDRPWEAAPLLREVLTAQQGDQVAAMTMQTAASYTSLLVSLGRFVEADSVLANALSLAERTGNGPGGMGVYLRATLGWLYWNEGRLGEAERTMRRVVEERLSVNGPDHPFTMWNQAQLGAILAARGRRKDGERLARHALETVQEKSPTSRIALAVIHSCLGSVLLQAGRAREAEEQYREELKLREGGSQGWIAESESKIGECLLKQGRLSEAEPLIARTYPVLSRVRGKDHPARRDARRCVEELYRRMNMPEKATALLASPTLEDLAKGT